MKLKQKVSTTTNTLFYEWFSYLFLIILFYYSLKKCIYSPTVKQTRLIISNVFSSALKKNSFIVQELIKHPPPLVEEHHETIPLEGPETTDTELGTQVANQKAVEALTFLLQKLPNKFALHSDEENSVHAEINDEILQDYKVTTPPTVFKQHSIPSDPVHIPQFKPIKPAITSTYTFQLGPIESVTGPDSKLILPHPIPHHQHIPHYDLVPPPVPITSSHNTNENAQYSYKIHSDAIESPPLNPLDLYHTMTIKNNNNNAPNTLLYVPPSPNQQPLFEIQKSIQYQLQH